MAAGCLSRVGCPGANFRAAAGAQGAVTLRPLVSAGGVASVLAQKVPGAPARPTPAGSRLRGPPPSFPLALWGELGFWGARFVRRAEPWDSGPTDVAGPQVRGPPFQWRPGWPARGTPLRPGLSGGGWSRASGVSERPVGWLLLASERLPSPTPPAGPMATWPASWCRATRPTKARRAAPSRSAGGSATSWRSCGCRRGTSPRQQVRWAGGRQASPLRPGQRGPGLGAVRGHKSTGPASADRPGSSCTPCARLCRQALRDQPPVGQENQHSLFFFFFF